MMIQVTLFITLMIVGLLWYFKPRRTSQYPESPYISQAIPFIGHLLGQLWYGRYYYKMISLGALAGQVYIVNSPELASCVHRSEKTMTFKPIVAWLMSSLCVLDARSRGILSADAFEKGQKNGGLLPALDHMQNVALNPGPDLDEMTGAQIELFGKFFNKLPREGQDVFGLYGWVRSALMPTEARAVFGPNHMFLDKPELLKEFWYLDEKLIPVTLGIPRMFAQKAYTSREKLLTALEEYYEMGHHREACAWVKRRFEIARSFGMSTNMAARLEVATFFAIFILTMPTTFFFIAEIFSRPALLQELRSEIESTLSSANATESPSQPRYRINLGKLKTECPHFFSAYREILRLSTNVSVSRIILADTILADRYLLRKGSIAQVIGRTIHADKKVWGHDAEQFNSRRFMEHPFGAYTGKPPDTGLREGDTITHKPTKVHPAAFRSYGGGSIVCPGRHFAQSEMLGFTAGLILGFDITGLDGQPVSVPPRDDNSISISMPKPLKDTHARITRRTGWEAVDFEYSL